MSDDDLAKLEQLLAEVSPGDWVISERGWESDRSKAGIMIVVDDGPGVSDDATDEEIDALDDAATEVAGVMLVKDARFICHARNVLPDLIAEIRRLRVEG